MGKIFYIMGKSAAGKDRIYSLLAGNKELNPEETGTVYDQTDPRGRAGWSSVLFYR